LFTGLIELDIYAEVIFVIQQQILGPLSTDYTIRPPGLSHDIQSFSGFHPFRVRLTMGASTTSALINQRREAQCPFPNF
jgi:hypothetical protein